MYLKFLIISILISLAVIFLIQFLLLNPAIPGPSTSLATIYLITPTYERHVQKAELVRLSHTFMLVPSVHWIIVEDSQNETNLITKFIYKLKTKYNFRDITHLYEPTPTEFKLKPGEPTWKKPKGVWQRNKALDWLRTNTENLHDDGVIYFADDDNTYDLELFDEMRNTEMVSVWPVAFAGGLIVEKPLVEEGKVVGFNSMWRPERPFPLDMAGFALSMKLFERKLNCRFHANQKVGYLESNFLSQLVDSWDDLQPMASDCSKVLVWHTKTQKPSLHEERKLTNASSKGLEW